MSVLSAQHAAATKTLKVTPSPLAVAANAAKADYVRTWSVAAAGCAAGILGLTGTSGFALYAAQHVVAVLVLLRAMRWRPADYFPGTTTLGFAATGLVDLPALLTFIFFWLIAYALVHVY